MDDNIIKDCQSCKFYTNNRSPYHIIFDGPICTGNRMDGCSHWEIALWGQGTNQTSELFSVEQIKGAFWGEFHKSGELWFDYLGDEEECNDSTNGSWRSFLEALGQLGDSNE